MDFDGPKLSFEVNPIDFRVEFTKKLGELRNTLVLLYKKNITTSFINSLKEKQKNIQFSEIILNLVSFNKLNCFTNSWIKKKLLK